MDSGLRTEPAESAQLDTLPLELLTHIFTFLTAEEHQRCAVLCKRFLALIGTWRQRPTPNTWRVVRYDEPGSCVLALPGNMHRLEMLIGAAGTSLREVDARGWVHGLNGSRKALRAVHKWLTEQQLAVVEVLRFGDDTDYTWAANLSEVNDILAACPSLTLLECPVSCDWDELADWANLLTATNAAKPGKLRCSSLHIPWSSSQFCFEGLAALLHAMSCTGSERIFLIPQTAHSMRGLAAELSGSAATLELHVTYDEEPDDDEDGAAGA